MRNTQKYIEDLYLVTFTVTMQRGFNSLGKLPYSLLAIQFSPLNLEATTYSLCVFSSYLGNIFADYIDYFLSVYFKISHYNFNNLGILVLIENALNLIPLFYTLIIPNKFFSKNKENPPNWRIFSILRFNYKFHLVTYFHFSHPFNFHSSAALFQYTVLTSLFE